MALVAALLAGTLMPDLAGATTIDNTFELDGNPQTSEALGDDWQTLLTGAGASIAKTAIPVVDGADAPADISYFKGGGSKDERDITQWAYSGTDVAPDKDEIVNAAAAAYNVADGPDADNDQDLVITFHSDRFSNDGDAAIGFWFFKNNVTLGSSGRFNGVHAVGDVLVVSDFNEGENINTVRVFTWNGSGLTEASVGTGALDCQEPNHNVNVCATENRSNQDDIDAVWAYTPKPNVGVPGKYPDFTFLEGGINISRVLPNSDECFASFLAETRSATSTTAQLKDFVLGTFPICAPSTTLSASPSTANPEIVVAGDSVTYRFTETNDGNVTLTNVKVTTNNTACNSAMTPSGTVTLAAGASQVFACTLTTNATTPAVTEIIGTGSGTSPLGNVTYCTDPANPPANTFCDQDERATAKSVSILPGTDIAISANPTVAKDGNNVIFTITETNDGQAPSGFSASLALANVGVASPAGDCNAQLADNSGAPDSKAGGDTDDLLEPGESWVWTCVVQVVGGNDLTVQVTGTGTVLTGTARQRTVTFCADPQNPPSGTFCDQEERASATVDVVNPSTALNVTASALITYTFVETNDGDVALDPPTAGQRNSFISVAAASVCNAAPGYVSGDTDNDVKLDVGESWTFTCQGTLAGPSADTGSKSDTIDGRGHGKDATGDDVTWCTDPNNRPAGTQCDQHERDRVTVTIENHPQG